MNKMAKSPSNKISLTEIHERVVKLEGVAHAGHNRIDRIENLLQETLKELRDVIGWMNRAKGWAAAGILIAGLIGGFIAKKF